MTNMNEIISGCCQKGEHEICGGGNVLRGFCDCPCHSRFARNWLTRARKAESELERVRENYVSKEQVRPLVEALQKAENAIQRHAGINDETRLGWALNDVAAALTHVRTLGL